MLIRDRIAVGVGAAVSFISRAAGLGAGATWPGEIALSVSPNLFHSLGRVPYEGVILIVGTNGKTTTALMLAQILNNEGKNVIHNASGANLLNGIVSSMIMTADWLGNVKADWGTFEVDENSLPIVLRYVTPKAIVFLNLFRDQLDRYGEVDVIVEKWEKALSKTSQSTTLVINSDDPALVHIGATYKGQVVYFGVNDKTKYLTRPEHATDSAFCPACGSRLTYEGVYYSHIGVYRCAKCGFKRPKPDIHTFPSALPGLYNQYNTLAAVAAAQVVGVPRESIETSLHAFYPAFGRQEEIVVGGKHIRLFLSKNPAGFNASLRTALEMGAVDFLFVLNDRIPDGRDVSWIWDVDFEMLPAYITPVVSGDRAWDMALRLKYAKPYQGIPQGAVSEPETPVITYEHLETALRFFTESSDKTKSLYVLATYSAMLEVRKILTGRKIL